MTAPNDHNQKEVVDYDNPIGRVVSAVVDLLRPKAIIIQFFWDNVFRSTSKGLSDYSTQIDKDFADHLQPQSSQDGRKSVFHDVVYSNDLDNDKEIREVTNILRPTVKVGALILAIFTGIFVLWGVLAGLDSAAIANGTIVVSSSRKTIQHLEGGIVDEIFVKAGDVVKKDQPLVRLRDTLAKARTTISSQGLRVALATQARLAAERDEAESIDFGNLNELAKTDPELERAVKNQNSLFVSRRKSLLGQMAIAQERIDQNMKLIDGLNAQVKSAESQIKLVNEESKMVESLFKKGLATKTKMLAVKRQFHDLEGRRGGYIAQIAKTEEAISEQKQAISNIRNTNIKEVLEELKNNQEKLTNLQQQDHAASDVLKRTVIKAPQSGTVTNVQIHTIGGVIAPGGKLMDIVPNTDEMIVEAKASIKDIDVIYKGMKAKVMLSAYKARFVPRLPGKVIHVSPDRYMDEQTGVPYFKVKVEIPKSAISRLAEDVKMYPGMPAEVFLLTGSSTFFDYLLSPLVDSFRRAFRET